MTEYFGRMNKRNSLERDYLFGGFIISKWSSIFQFPFVLERFNICDAIVLTSTLYKYNGEYIFTIIISNLQIKYNYMRWWNIFVLSSKFPEMYTSSRIFDLLMKFNGKYRFKSEYKISIYIPFMKCVLSRKSSSIINWFMARVGSLLFQKLIDIWLTLLNF